MKALEFTGSGSEYFKIWIVNVLLTMLTLGLYYPWAKVRNKRYFHGNSILDGRNFEYHALGKQIFLGYLIAIILLVAYLVIQKISPVGSLVLIGVLFLAVPWIIVRSLMFNMKMTSFSNVHFQFTGSFAKAYTNFLAYPLAMYIGFTAIGGLLVLIFQISNESLKTILIIVTVIVELTFMVYAFAFLKKKNTEYIINNLHFGQGKFTVNLDINQLRNIVLGTTGIAIVSMVGVFVIMGLLVYITIGMESISQMSSAFSSSETSDEKLGLIMPIIAIIYLGMILSMIIAISYSFTKNRAYIFAKTVLDGSTTFESTLEVIPLAWILVSNFFLVICTLGLGMPWARVRAARVMIENTLVDTPNGIDQYVSQQQAKASALGDQVGDAFDVDVDIGL